MKKDAITCFLSINVLIWGLTSLLYAQNKRPMTVDDALNIVRVGELASSGYEPELAETVLMSPDGELIFYSERIVDWENNGYKRNYYMASSPGGEPKQFIGSAGGGDFQVLTGREVSFADSCHRRRPACFLNSRFRWRGTAAHPARRRCQANRSLGGRATHLYHLQVGSRRIDGLFHC